VVLYLVVFGFVGAVADSVVVLSFKWAGGACVRHNTLILFGYFSLVVPITSRNNRRERKRRKKSCETRAAPI
jgi:hypothetical protein